MRAGVSLLLLALLLSGSLGAQVGSTTDVLTGVVTDDQDRPLAEAVVEATSLETEITRQARTDARGRYTILFPDGGGHYRLTVRSIGMQPFQGVVQRFADEDRIVTNVRMSSVPTRLSEVVVQGRRPPPMGGRDLPTPGAVERVVTPDQLSRLPVDASDLNVLALLAPGVVAVAGDDSTAAGFSVAGQRPASNATTLDGASFGAGMIPQEALRASRVITSSYDVARGQFSGGQISMTSRGGTNVRQGSMSWSLRDEELTFGDDGRDPFARGFSQNQFSGGAGGPIVRDRLFFFGSGQARLRSDAFQTLLNAPAGALDRLGTNPDSLARFLGLAEQAGAPIPTRVNDSRSSDDFSGLARLDWLIAPAHTVTVRGDLRYNRQDPTRTSPLSLPEVAGRNSSTGGGGLLTLSSRFGMQVLNEFRVYANRSRNTGEAFTDLPQGRVQVASQLADGGTGVANYLFGGNPMAARSSLTTGLEVANEISWISPAGAHRVKFGLLYKEGRSEQDVSANRFGTFTYQSLQDLEANRPSTFTRTLAPATRASTSVDHAAYLADTWRAGGGWQLTYGLRLERSGFRGAPEYNPQAEALFGVRTDRLPAETRLSPRVGFSWMPQGGGFGQPPRYTVRGGIGEFRSPVPAMLVGSALAATGLSASEAQLFCVGANVPVPDWAAYRADAASIPMACLDGASGTLPTRSPSVTVFASDFEAPRALRASLGATRRMGLTRSLNLDLSWARGAGQSGVTDLNLGDQRFTLAAEGGRPVYANPAAIDPASGAIPVAASRIHPSYGQVLALDSRMGSRAWQATLSYTGVILQRGLMYTVSYTWSDVRDQGSGGSGRGFGGQSTAGDPNVRDWARSDFGRTHSLLATVTYPVLTGLEITTISRLSSGTPYTPMAGGDINGDGARNDRAFVFSPAAAPDAEVSAAMQRLLAEGSPGARACLEAQVGRVADRNSCTGPWQPSVEFQVNYRPDWFGLQRRLTLSLTTVNLLGGIDQLLHGTDGIKGWGQGARPDGTLLYVRGFDPQTRQFRYVVNERFGATGARGTAIRIPFQLGIQARYALGPNRGGIQGLLGGMGDRGGMGGMGGGGGFGGGAGAMGGRGMMGGLLGGGDTASFAARFGNLVANPARQIIDRRIQLRLTEAQVQALSAEADSFEARAAALARDLEKRVADLGATPDIGRAMTLIRPAMESAQALRRRSLEAAQQILTPEQWSGLPAALTQPPQFPGIPGGAAPGARRPPGGGGEKGEGSSEQ
jgi:plasmid stabilization system protein ParE